MKKKLEKFGWVGKTKKSRKIFPSASDAARAGINANPRSVGFVYVVSSVKGYIGTAEGINFHS